MKRIIVLVVFLSVSVLACTAPQKASTKPDTLPPTAESEGKLPAKPSLSEWELKWDNILKAAKKEGRVVIYTGAGSELRTGLTKAFQSTYKDIDLEFFAGRGPEITQKLLSEHRAGLFLADVYISGATTSLSQLKPAGALVPLEPYLILPEVIDPKAWFEGELPFVDKDKINLAFIAFPSPSVTINTRLVKEAEMKSYRDLLDPKWKGKIVMDDPTSAGPGLKWFGVTGKRILDYDYMRQLVRQEPVIMRDARLPVEWVAQGKYSLGIALWSPIITEFQRAGTPLKQILMMEGSYISSSIGTLAIIKGTPHKNATHLFVNWLLSKEGQLAWSKADRRQSARVDIPIDHLDREQTRQPGTKYVSGDDEELLLEQPKQADLAKEIFKGLLAR